MAFTYKAKIWLVTRERCRVHIKSNPHNNFPIQISDYYTHIVPISDLFPFSPPWPPDACPTPRRWRLPSPASCRRRRRRRRHRSRHCHTIVVVGVVGVIAVGVVVVELVVIATVTAAVIIIVAVTAFVFALSPS